VVQAQEVYVDNVVVVLDASGSMKSNMRGSSMPKITAARNAIKEVIQTIPQTTRVGLLVFGGGADGWVYQLGPRDDQKLFASLQRISASGGTPLGSYMKTGADKLPYRRANDPAALRRAIQEVFAEVGKVSDGQSGEGAFDELAGLPEEVAMAMIAALVSSGNHPIGGKPGSAVASSAQASRPQVAPVAKARRRSRRGTGPWMVVAVVIAIIVLKAISGGKRR
jgi:hypothetical protein